MSLLSVWVSARPEACYTLCHFWDSKSLFRLATLYVTSETLCEFFDSLHCMSLLRLYVTFETLYHFWDSMSLFRLSTLYVTFETLFRTTYTVCHFFDSLSDLSWVYFGVSTCSRVSQSNRNQIETNKFFAWLYVDGCRSWTSMYEVEQVCTKLNKYVIIEYFGGHFCVCVRFVFVFQMGCVLVSLYADGWCWIWIKHVPRRC